MDRLPNWSCHRAHVLILMKHTYNNIYEVSEVKMQSRAQQDKKQESFLQTQQCSAVQEELLMNMRCLETDGIVMCRVYVSAKHRSDQSHGFIKAHEDFIEIRGRRLFRKKQFFWVDTVLPSVQITHLIEQPGGIVITQAFL